MAIKILSLQNPLTIHKQSLKSSHKYQLNPHAITTKSLNNYYEKLLIKFFNFKKHKLTLAVLKLQK